MKAHSTLSGVLTLATLVAGLLVASGCVRRMAAASPAPERVTSKVIQEPLVSEAPSANESPVTAALSSPRQTELVEDDRPMVQPQTVPEPPPLPQVEVLGRPPGPGVTWLPGHWEWDGGWTWRSGRWIAMPAPDAMWVPGRWVRTEGGWTWVEGFWRTALK